MESYCSMIRVLTSFCALHKDDLNPRVLKESGFKHLDRVIELCAQHNIYTILDLHVAPGGQNTDWHSDHGGHIANCEYFSLNSLGWR